MFNFFKKEQFIRITFDNKKGTSSLNVTGNGEAIVKMLLHLFGDERLKPLVQRALYLRAQEELSQLVPMLMEKEKLSQRGETES